ncbi:BnaCnng56950D [Brassica napus]|uniref:BnaCnng56950D protein n=1 Tax=Brassica napus TaxID=3708 RepID=A0A078JM77_BRANA|nr:BnaCnng56950D [Brassica napus]
MYVKVSKFNIKTYRFCGINMDHQSKDPEHIFVYDLGTQTTERLPQWVVSSVGFSDARWFFPDTNH